MYFKWTDFDIPLSGASWRQVLEKMEPWAMEPRRCDAAVGGARVSKNGCHDFQFVMGQEIVEPMS